MPNDLNDFFSDYRDAFARLDADAIASLYTMPCGIQSFDQVSYWSTRATFVPVMTGLCERYRAGGIQNIAFRENAYVPQGENGAFVDLQSVSYTHLTLPTIYSV